MTAITKIQPSQISVSTSHEDVINAGFQLSKLSTFERGEKEERITAIVGNRERSAVIKKPYSKLIDNSKAVDFIQLLMNGIFQWFSKDITPELSRSLANKIYNDYYWMKTTELVLFTERMKGGYWKQLHNLSPAVIMERLTDFADESLELRQNLSYANEDKSEVSLPLTEQQKKDFHEFTLEITKRIADRDKQKTDQQLERAVDTHNWHKGNEAMVKWLFESGDKCLESSTDHDKVKWYNLFLIRK